MKRISKFRFKKVYVAIPILMILALGIIPAFALTFPPYLNCDLRTTSPGDGAGCTPSTGEIRGFANADGGSSVGQTFTYMYSDPIWFGQDTVRLDDIRANINAKLSASAGGYATMHVIAYLSDPATCNPDWVCAKDGITSTLLNKLITSGTWSTNTVYYGPVVNYSTTGSHYVVAYADGEGSYGSSYADYGPYNGGTEKITNFNIDLTIT